MWLKFTYQGQKHKHKVPLSWEELTLAQLCRVFDVYAEKNTPSYVDIISALIGIEKEIVEQIKMSQLDEKVLIHLQYLSDAKMWESLYKGTPQKQFYIDKKLFNVIGFDIPNELTLKQKTEILEGIKSCHNWLDKCKLIFMVLYAYELKGGEVAIEIFPVVTFFLLSLKRSLIIGNLVSKASQVMKNSSQE